MSTGGEEEVGEGKTTVAIFNQTTLDIRTQTLNILASLRLWLLVSMNATANIESEIYFIHICINPLMYN